MFEGRLETVFVSGTPVVQLSGDFDLANVKMFESALRTLSTYRAIIVDFTKARYLDSTTINAVLNFADRQRSGGRRLYLVSPVSSQVRRILDVVGVASTVRTFESVDAAIASLHGELGESS